MIHAVNIGLVHLVPNWLVTTVEGLADQRFNPRYSPKGQKGSSRKSQTIGTDRAFGQTALGRYACCRNTPQRSRQRGLTARSFISMKSFDVPFEQLLEIFEDQELLFN